jgi:ABC-type transport system involved in cytochrome c biogenesis permease subunit
MKFPLTLLIATALLATGSLSARELPKSDLDSYEPWDEEVVHTFENLLVQDGGRVKPIYTYARFTLMQFSGKTQAKFQTKDGVDHKLHYAEWLLDVLFRGEVAKDIPTFVVDDSAAVVQIGVSPNEKKRSVYSYNDLVSGRARLAELAAEYAEKQRKYEQSERRDKQYELGRVEGMILTLGQNVSSFEYLIGQFGFARDGQILVNENILPPALIELAAKTSPAEMLREMPMPEMTIDQLVGIIQQPASQNEDERTLQDVFRLYFFFANTSRGINLFPPQESDNEVWLSASDVMLKGLESKEARPWAAEQLQSIETLVDARNESPAAFSSALTEFAKNQHSISDPRGEGLYSEMEVQLYRGKYFIYSLYCFVLAFIVMAFSWLTPGSRIGRGLLLAAGGIALIGLGLDVYGITLRSIIRQRPPITNLYDTVLFITGTAVLLGLLIELFTRKGIGTLVAIVSGVFGMFLSIKYEAKEATDTITQLVAVLDTNFWLATHVTIINIGYAAALVAAIIGIVYLVARFVMMMLGKESSDLNRSLTRMNYGVICFCLFFSLVGTVLGGIWANYSWGRFWGWDPKENGALMICLWSLVILHGRMAGWIRDLGVHMNSIILAIITTFSWWGVNNLGVGLHSYGFTEGVWGALYTSWMILGVFMAMGVIIWFSERSQRAMKKQETRSSTKAATA